jgi:hypothetical protein
MGGGGMLSGDAGPARGLPDALPAGFAASAPGPLEVRLLSAGAEIARSKAFLLAYLDGARRLVSACVTEDPRLARTDGAQPVGIEQLVGTVLLRWFFTWRSAGKPPEQALLALEGLILRGLEGSGYGLPPGFGPDGGGGGGPGRPRPAPEAPPGRGRLAVPPRLPLTRP